MGTKEKKAAMTHLLESDDEEDKKSTDTKDSESEPKEDTKKADKDEKKDESESKDKEDKEDFAGATVMTIAHRLNTIIESDKVLFMDKGTVLEYDNPQTLMADPSSAFSKLIQEKKKRGSKEQQEAGAE